MNRYKLGDPAATSTTVGPVISQAALNNIKAHVADALAKGAQDVTPANETFANPPAQGNYLAPVVLTGVNHEMEVMKEETFGPVMPIMKVSSDEEAVRLMNDSDYGLTASVWTKDIARGEELVEDIEAGTVYINRADYPSPVRLSLKDYLNDSMLTRVTRTWHGLGGRTRGWDARWDRMRSRRFTSSRASTSARSRVD